MTRLRVIYEPKGRAREYAPLALNLYRGCEHGCRYCYAPRAMHMREPDFRTAAPRRGVLAALERDARQLAGDERPVHLCFSCDPYTPINARLRLTRSAIAVLKGHDLRVQILTKGGRAVERDLDLLGPEDAVGATLTFVSPRLSAEWEPGAAPPDDRLAGLAAARRAGIGTWASVEPVIDPVESLAIVRQAARWVDRFKLGAWNYSAAANGLDWAAYYERVTGMLGGLGIPYMVKADLLERADRG